MVAIARKRLIRKAQGKESRFRVRGYLVAPEKIDRYMRRKNMSEWALLSRSDSAECMCVRFLLLPDHDGQTVLTFCPLASSSDISCSTPSVQGSPTQDVAAPVRPAGQRSIDPPSLAAHHLSPSPAAAMSMGNGSDPTFALSCYYENVGSWLLDQGRVVEAETAYQRAMDEYEKLLRKTHPDSLPTRGNPTAVLMEQSSYRRTKHLVRKVLDVREKMLGKSQQETLVSLRNLSALLQEPVERLCQYKLDECEEILGLTHPTTLETMDDVAVVLCKLGKYWMAKEVSQQVLDVREKLLGRSHPQTLVSAGNLALVTRILGLSQAEEELWQQVLNGPGKRPGKDDQFILESMSNLASVVQCHGKR